MQTTTLGKNGKRVGRIGLGAMGMRLWAVDE